MQTQTDYNPRMAQNAFPVAEAVLDNELDDAEMYDEAMEALEGIREYKAEADEMIQEIEETSGREVQVPVAELEETTTELVAQLNQLHGATYAEDSYEQAVQNGNAGMRGDNEKAVAQAGEKVTSGLVAQIVNETEARTGTDVLEEMGPEESAGYHEFMGYRNAQRAMNALSDGDVESAVEILGMPGENS